MSAVLRQVIPDGTMWGRLGEIFTDWSELSISQDIKDAGVIQFTYPVDGVHYDLLKTGIFVTVVIDGSYRWHDSIYYLRELEGVAIGEDRGTTSFQGVSLKKLLEDVRWMPAIGSEYMDSASFKYLNVTPGTVLKAGVENYWSRERKIPTAPVKWIYDVAVSPDNEWYFRVDEEIDPTTSVWSMVSKYQELGIATVRFWGFRMQTAHYEWYTGNEQFQKQDSVRFIRGKNIRNETYAESNEDLVTSLLVVGSHDELREQDAGISSSVVAWVQAPQNIIDKWGYHERVLEVREASTVGTLKAIGEAHMRYRMEPRYSRSFDVIDRIFDSRGKRIPSPRAFVDFEAGNMVSVFNGSNISEERVFAVTLSWTDEGSTPKVSVTLNDFFEDWEVTLDQRLQRLGG